MPVYRMRQMACHHRHSIAFPASVRESRFVIGLLGDSEIVTDDTTLIAIAVADQKRPACNARPHPTTETIVCDRNAHYVFVM